MNVHQADTDQRDGSCPACHASLQAGAVLCVNCGYHLKHGRQLATTVDAAADDKSQDHESLPPAVLRKAEALAKEGEFVFVAIALAAVCGIAWVVMFPWYLVRLMTWRRLNDKYESLGNSLSPHGDLAVRFQKASTRITIGLIVGGILSVLWCLLAARAGYVVSNQRELPENQQPPPTRKNAGLLPPTRPPEPADPARHKGDGRIGAGLYAISLVPPPGWEQAPNVPETKLAFRGPVHRWSVQEGFAVVLTVRADPYDGHPPIEEFPNQRAELPPELKFVEDGFGEIDYKKTYYLITEARTENGPIVKDLQYFIPGKATMYVVSMIAAKEAFAGHEDAFDKVLLSIRID